MEEHGFLVSLGWTFGGVFTLLTALCVYRFLRIRDQAALGRKRVAAAVSSLEGRDGEIRASWEALEEIKGQLNGDISRASQIASSIPAVALVGTVAGFYYALRNTGQMDLAATDPLMILQALMANGVSTALATTLAGQVLNVALGQLYAFGLAGPVEEVSVLLDEALALLRARMTVRP